MSDTPASEELSRELDQKFGHLFNDPNKRAEMLASGELSEDEETLLEGGCIIDGGDSVCRRGNAWVVC